MNGVLGIAIQVWVITQGKFWYLLVLTPVTVMFAFLARCLWREGSTGEVLLQRDGDMLVGKVLRKPLIGKSLREPLPAKSASFRLWLMGARLILYRDGRMVSLLASNGWAVDGQRLRGEQLAQALVELGLAFR